MPAPVRAFRSWRPSPTVLRRTFLGALVMNVVIVVTGGAVRLTASGLGCPTFPRCTDTSLVVTREMGAHGVIEFGNRMLTFVLTAAVGAALVVAWRAGRRDLRGRALVLTGGIVAQALLGGVTVLTGLNPVTVMAHFLLSMLLIAVAVDAYERTAPPADPAARDVRREVRVGTWVLTAAVGLVLFLGTVVTGTGPHSGDKQASDRLPFDLETVSQLHADVVFLVIGLTVGLLVAARASRAPELVRRRLAVLLGVVLAQGVVGYAQYLTDLPVFLVGVHVLGACLVWVATVRVALGAAGTGGVGTPGQSSEEPLPLLSPPPPEPELSSSEPPPPPPEPELSSSIEKRGRPPEQVTRTSTRPSPSPEDSNRTRA